MLFGQCRTLSFGVGLAAGLGRSDVGPGLGGLDLVVWTWCLDLVPWTLVADLVLWTRVTDLVLWTLVLDLRLWTLSFGLSFFCRPLSRQLSSTVWTLIFVALLDFVWPSNT